jgi:hypothetical protein
MFQHALRISLERQCAMQTYTIEIYFCAPVPQAILPGAYSIRSSRT